MKKKQSIHDLAKQLGVSATAISFVINGKAAEKGISDELQQRVLKHISEVGYKPNLLAQSLRTGKSNIIGMLVEDISDPFFSNIARGVEINASKLGYKIFYASTENDTEKTKSLIKAFRERQVDAYIIAPPPDIEEDIQSLMNDDLLVILFDRYLPSISTNNIVIDNYEGAFKAVKHLNKNGYENVGFITLDSAQSQMADRLEGYKKAVGKKSQQKILPIIYRSASQGIVEKIKQFLTLNKELQAVLFATNYLTSYGLEAMHELKLIMPVDLAIVSFDDNTMFKLTSPSITAVAQPMEELSEKLVMKLVACLTDPSQNEKKETIVIPTRLVVRKSSASINEVHMQV